jgi:hypothetical protein
MLLELTKAVIALVFDQFKEIWDALVHFDQDESTFTINKSATSDQPISLSDAVIVLQSYQKLPEFAVQLWEDLDRVILKPRTDIGNRSLRSIDILDVCVDTHCCEHDFSCSYS